MKLKLLLLYSIHTTYGRIQMTEMPERPNKTSLVVVKTKEGLINRIQEGCHSTLSVRP